MKIKLADGKTIADGDEVTLVLWTAMHANAVTGAREEISKTISGMVHSFDQDGETRWEVTTGDPAYPAIGFIPETSKLAKS